MHCLQYLDLLTVDTIRVVFEKVLLTGILKERGRLDLKDFLEAIAIEGYFDRKRVKSIKQKDNKKFTALKDTLENKFNQKEICEMIGIHRNSYKNYF